MFAALHLGSQLFCYCRVPVGQGEAGVAVQQVVMSPVLLATIAGMVINTLQLPVPPTVCSPTDTSS